MTIQDFIFGVGGINILLAIIVIFLRRDEEPQSTLMWIMIMMFIPGIGFILYLFLGHDYRKSKMFDTKLKEDELIDIAVKKQEDFVSGSEIPETYSGLEDHYDLINLNLQSDQAIFTADNSVDVYYWGDEKFEALLEDLRNAKKSIEMQYYIFKADGIGTQILDILEDRARNGVKVRLLIDGVGGRTLKSSDLQGLKDAGGQVASFFSGLFGFINIRLNYRNHRKITVIDDSIGYIGGFNVGDDYLGKYEKHGPWRDTHIRIVGSSVSGLKLRFIKDWTHATDNHDLDMSQENIDYRGSYDGQVGIQIVTSGPDTELENIKNAICKMITEAQDEIIIQTPYFIPDDTIMDLLSIQITSGVKVKIMIPGNPDHPFVFPAGIFYLGKLAKIGAKIYLYDYGFIHSKNIIVDDKLSTVGSANMDNRSFRLNFESNAIIYDKEINESLRQQFYIDAERSHIMTYDDYLNRPLSLKVKEIISKFLSPIL